MISADLITDNSSNTSSIRTGENTCLYPNTTSMAVSTSSAAQTQKYCPLVSCVAVSCISGSLNQARIGCPILLSRFLRKRVGILTSQTCPGPRLADLRRHQIHQWEDEHPHQINKVPIQPANFNVVRVVVLRFEKHDHRSHEQSDTQCMHRIVKYIAGRNHERAG